MEKQELNKYQKAAARLFNALIGEQCISESQAYQDYALIKEVLDCLMICKEDTKPRDIVFWQQVWLPQEEIAKHDHIDLHSKVNW